MRDWIAGAIGLLGALLVLGGAATILSRAWFNRPPAEEPPTAPTPAYGVTNVAGRLARMSPPERLILWGALLLVLAAIAAGAIGFSLGAAAPAK
jgi:hypothetical protein